MIVEAAALYALYQRERYSWDSMLDRLRTDGAGIERLLGKTARRKHYVARWLAANDCQASYDSARQVQHPGLGQGYFSPAPMRGDGRGVILLLGRYTSDREGDRDPEGRLILIRKRAGKTSIETLEQDSYLGMLSPGDALAHGHYLSVSGLDQWGGNSPRVQVSWYRRSGATWRLKGALRAEHESWDPGTLRLSGARLPQPIEIESRTYPDNLDSSHATANLTHIHRWVWRNGWREVSKKRRETAFNTLDRLYASIQGGREAEVRRACVNGNLARRLLGMKANLAQSSPQIRYPGSICSVDATVIGVTNLNATLHFSWRQGRWKVSKIAPLNEST